MTFERDEDGNVKVEFNSNVRTAILELMRDEISDGEEGMDDMIVFVASALYCLVCPLMASGIDDDLIKSVMGGFIEQILADERANVDAVMEANEE